MEDYKKPTKKDPGINQSVFVSKARRYFFNAHMHIWINMEQRIGSTGAWSLRDFCKWPLTMVQVVKGWASSPDKFFGANVLNEQSMFLCKDCFSSKIWKSKQEKQPIYIILHQFTIIRSWLVCYFVFEYLCAQNISSFFFFMLFSFSDFMFSREVKSWFRSRTLGTWTNCVTQLMFNLPSANNILGCVICTICWCIWLDRSI